MWSKQSNSLNVYYDVLPRILSAFSVSPENSFSMPFSIEWPDTYSKKMKTKQTIANFSLFCKADAYMFSQMQSAMLDV